MTRPFSRRTSSSGWRRRARRPRRPTSCRSARRAGGGASARRAAPSSPRGRGRGRPCRAGPAVMRETASATRAGPLADRAPSAKATSRGLSGPPAGRPRVAGYGGHGGAGSTPTVVSHATPPRKPTTTSGTTSVAPAGESAAYDTDPKAIGPVPGGRPRRARRRCPRARSTRLELGHRPGPDAVRLAARPQPTTPSPRRTHEHTSRAPRVARGRAGPRRARGRAARCARRGGGGGDRVGRPVTRGQRGHRAARIRPRAVGRDGARWEDGAP